MIHTLIEELTVNKCGLFTFWHFIALLFCLLFVALFVLLTRNFTKDDVIKSCKVMAFVTLIFEIIKIIYKFKVKQTHLDSWFPLAYCSLLIYALFLSGYTKGWIQKMGHAFLSGPGFIAGMAFLIFPTTSLSMLPLLHFLSIHSMLYHAVMVYFGIMFYKTKVLDYEFKNGKYYLIFLIVFSTVAITMCYTLNCNMMFYGNPYNFPFQFVIDLYNYSNVLYTVFIFCVYFIMYYVVVLIVKFTKRLRKGVA